MVRHSYTYHTPCVMAYNVVLGIKLKNKQATKITGCMTEQA